MNRFIIILLVAISFIYPQNRKIYVDSLFVKMLNPATDTYQYGNITNFLKTVVTIKDTANLKKANYPDGSVVYLRGLISGSTIGAGYFVKSDSAYPEGGIAFDAPETGKQWVRQEYLDKKVVYLQWFGASSTGDVSSEISNALTVCPRVVINDSFNVNSTITVPAGRTLIFEKDGKLVGSGTIVGNNTIIKAGLYQIFDTNITLSGTWIIEETYPEWFGANADGSTNDYSYLTKAVSFAELTNSKVIKLTGSYKNTGKWVISNDLIIKGGKIIGYTSSPMNVGLFLNNHDIVLKDITFDSCEVRFDTTAYNITIDHCNFVNKIYEGSSSWCILNATGNSDIDSLSNISITNCRFENIQADAIRIYGHWMRDIKILGNTFHRIIPYPDNGTSSKEHLLVYINYDQTGISDYWTRAYDIIFANNVIRNIQNPVRIRPITIHAMNAIIANNMIDSIYFNADIAQLKGAMIRSSGKNVVINGNVITRLYNDYSGVETSYMTPGIICKSDSKFIISNNILNANKFGIAIQGQGNGIIQGNKIEADTVYNCFVCTTEDSHDSVVVENNYVRIKKYNNEFLKPKYGIVEFKNNYCNINDGNFIPVWSYITNFNLNVKGNTFISNDGFKFNFNRKGKYDISNNNFYFYNFSSTSRTTGVLYYSVDYPDSNLGFTVKDNKFYFDETDTLSPMTNIAGNQQWIGNEFYFDSSASDNLIYITQMQNGSDLIFKNNILKGSFVGYGGGSEFSLFILQYNDYGNINLDNNYIKITAPHTMRFYLKYFSKDNYLISKDNYIDGITRYMYDSQTADTVNHFYVLGDNFNATSFRYVNNSVFIDTVFNYINRNNSSFKDFANDREIKNLKITEQSSAPSSPAKGQIYFDGTHFYGYNGSAWVQLDN